jgi:NAD(P)-dependent dehydrogenase (short-subunit alcohol dehydrogenase family)
MNDKAVFITGAAGGIGSALVDTLAERGWTVYAGVRTPSDALADRPQVRQVTIDVTDPASVAAAAAEVGRAQGDRGLQALVNNAGVIVQGPLELVTDADLHRQFDVNVYGPVRVMRAFLPLLRAGGGRVVNVSAVTARVAMPFLGPISASKAALESLSDAARIELAAFGIPVVLVEPGAVATDILAKADQAAAAALTEVPPERLALYRPALAAVDRAVANQQPSPVRVAVSTLVEAVETARPKARYLAGRDARALAAVARLPVRVRDRLLARSMGLASAATPAPSAAAISAGRAS